MDSLQQLQINWQMLNDSEYLCQTKIGGIQLSKCKSQGTIEQKQTPDFAIDRLNGMRYWKPNTTGKKK